MQAAMNLSLKYCPKELEAYWSCIETNPSKWQQMCHEEKMKVANCTSSHPVIQKIRKDCSQEFVKFEQCLKENQNAPTACSAHASHFMVCAETVDLSGVSKNPSS